MKISDDIHNYYKKLVEEYVITTKLRQKYDEDFIADLICVALNNLPTRYIRHEVDMAFFLPPSELFDMESKVKKAMAKAIKFIEEKNK
ncbi:MAG: late competence development ComFB family protein [Colwellia sp.]